jgi:hypothetical protein
MDESQVTKSLNNLLRGLAHGSNETIYQSHRELYKVGELAIPVIEEQLMSYTWEGTKVGVEISILTGLLGLVHDINEKLAKDLGESIRAKGCSKTIDARIESILKFSLEQFELFQIKQLEIYLSKELTDRSRIRKKITQWLSTIPERELEKIERIYLIPEQNEHYRGTYMPVLCSIMVEWDMSTSHYNPLSYFFMLRIEQTLYHEIGHHVHKHAFDEHGEEENEADQYAFKLLRKNHTILRRIVRVARFIFGKSKTASENV